MRQINVKDQSVGAVGLGCMGMSWLYGPADELESLKTLSRALELGVDFWDTADVYGAGENEKLLAKTLKDNRSSVFLCTKFGNVYDRSMTAHQDQVEANKQWIVDGTPEYVKNCCDLSLQRLGIEQIDLYYQHRVDPQVPIEETVGAMSELVAAGKVKHIGLSEPSESTLRRAHAVHPIAAVQSEYSLWTRDYESDVIPACRELGAVFVPYSPLGRGFLTGAISKVDDLAADDYRRVTPRFSQENFQKNIALAEAVKAVAVRRHCTAAQVALAWVMAQGDHILPIPGTKRVKYLEENTRAVEVNLEPEDFDALAGLRASGDRYLPVAMEYLNG